MAWAQVKKKKKKKKKNPTQIMTCAPAYGLGTSKQSLKKEVATQTEEHLPPFELAPSSTWQIVETCIGELMFGPRGYSLLPLELFQEIVQHIQELKKCRFPLMSRCYKTIEIVFDEKGTLNSNMPLYF